MGRLESVDILRGMSMALMLLVDTISTTWPSFDHAPWNGLHIADFVMPTFLYLIGFSIAMANRRVYDGISTDEQKNLTRKAVKRGLKLFFIGIILQGAWFFTLYLSTVRICGILQRIAFVFTVLAVSEIWLCNGKMNNDDVNIVSSFLPSHFFVGLVPFASWFAVAHFVSSDGSGCKAGDWQEGFDPNCNIAGAIDTTILGREHLYQPMLQGYISFSSDSRITNYFERSAYGFDPEGIATTIGSVLTGYLGLVSGRYYVTRTQLEKRLHVDALIMTGENDERALLRYINSNATTDILFTWFKMGLLCLLISAFFTFIIGIPMNKRMWSAPYTFFTAGVAILMLCLLHKFHDKIENKNIVLRVLEYILRPFLYLGTNALLFFVLSDSGGVICQLSSTISNNEADNFSLVYFIKKNVLMDFFQLPCPAFTDYMIPLLSDTSPGKICGALPYHPDGCPMIQVYALAQLCLWIGICYYLYRIKWFWKV